MVRLSPADKTQYQIAHDIVDNSPYATTIREGVRDLRDALPDVGTRGRYTRVSGFDSTYQQQRIASLDPYLFFNLEKIDPELFHNKERFYAWLNKYGQEFDTRRKVD